MAGADDHEHGQHDGVTRPLSGPFLTPQELDDVLQQLCPSGGRCRPLFRFFGGGPWPRSARTVGHSSNGSPTLPVIPPSESRCGVPARDYGRGSVQRGGDGDRRTASRRGRGCLRPDLVPGPARCTPTWAHNSDTAARVSRLVPLGRPGRLGSRPSFPANLLRDPRWPGHRDWWGGAGSGGATTARPAGAG